MISNQKFNSKKTGIYENWWVFPKFSKAIPEVWYEFWFENLFYNN
jgi:hypothetical protein